MVRLLLNLTFIAAMTLSSLLAQDIVQTCDCPGLDEFTQDIHTVLSHMYDQEKDYEVPVEFDQLTLIMDLESKSAIKLSCSQFKDHENNFEKDLQQKILLGELQDQLENSIRVTANDTTLSNLTPNFIRVASDSDRTLFFRASIGGEDKNIIMHVSQDGTVTIDFIDRMPVVVKFPATADHDVALSLPPVAPKPPSVQTHRPLKKITNDSQSGQLMMEGGTRIIDDDGMPRIDGIGFDHSVKSEHGHVVQGGVNIRANNIRFPSHEQLEQLEHGEIASVDLPPDSVTIDVGAQYYHDLGGSAGQDHGIHVRADHSKEVDQDNNILSQRSALALSYRNGENDLTLKASQSQYGSRDKQERYELSYGNLRKNRSDYYGLQSALDINAPNLTFGSFPSEDKYEDMSDYLPDEAHIHHVKVAGSNEGVTSASAILANKEGEDMSLLSGQYRFDDDSYRLQYSAGTSDRRTNLEISRDRDLDTTAQVSHYSSQEKNPNGSSTTKQEHFTTLTLSQSENTANSLSYDHVLTNNQIQTQGDVTTQETHSRQMGITIEQEGTTELRFSSDQKVQHSLGENEQEYATSRRYIAGQASFGQDEVEARALVMKQQTLHGYTTGSALDAYGKWSDAGSATEVGFSIMTAKGLGDWTDSTDCRLAARNETGLARTDTRRPSFGTNYYGNGRRTSCNITFINDDDAGLEADVSIGYSYQDMTPQGKSKRYYVDVGGKLNDDSGKSFGDTLKLNFGGEIQF